MSSDGEPGSVPPFTPEYDHRLDNQPPHHQNLMLNAIEAMKDSGGEPTVRSQLQDSRLLFSVSDMGVGLPTEKGDQIFSAFFTTKTQGSRIGLAISRVAAWLTTFLTSRALPGSKARLEEAQHVARVGYFVWNLDTDRVT
jgi:hypothetical protein